MVRHKHIKPSLELLIIGSLLFAVWAVGAVFYHLVEGLSYVDAAYFTSMTIATVGYGDFTPKTEIGKIFTSIYVFIGVGIFLGFAAVLFQNIAEKIRHRH
jgi:voltage-gated potassium channel